MGGVTDGGPREPPAYRRTTGRQEQDLERPTASPTPVAESPLRRFALRSRAWVVTVRRTHARRVIVISALLAVCIALFVSTCAVVAALVTSPLPTPEASAQVSAEPQTVAPTLPLPEPAQSIPTPVTVAVAAVPDICAIPAVLEALDVGDDVAAIAAAGAANFRTSVALGAAPCVSLSDPSRLWVVVNKLRPYEPLEYAPASTPNPDGVRVTEGGGLRPDAAAALSAMVRAADEAGVGEIALASGYRSYANQESTYSYHVQREGVDEADATSAHPGFSEHQSGLVGDVAACNGGCGRLDELAGTAQGDFVAANAWEYGFIVRYEDGYTGITGYQSEPWHLRYIGVDLAREYRSGGWHTLEEFFGLPPAPQYAG